MGRRPGPEDGERVAHDARISDLTSAPRITYYWNAVQANWHFYAASLAAQGALSAFIAGKGYLDFGANHLAPGTGFWVNMPATPLEPGPPPALARTAFASGFTAPLGFENPRGGTDRNFIVEQDGTIRIIQNGSVLAAPLSRHRR